MSKISIAKEFIIFLKDNKKWWLLPIAIFLLSFGIFILFVEGSAIAPFIYTLF